MDFRILLNEQLLFCGKTNVLKLMVQLIFYAHVQAWCGHGFKMDNKTPILLNLNRMPCNDIHLHFLIMYFSTECFRFQ